MLDFRDIPIGFTLADIESEVKDIAEFYIIPAMRRMKFGYLLATTVFNKHPGQWQIRQIEGATDATFFWRSVVKQYTNHQYEESLEKDHRWGIVTRQHFHSYSSKL